MIDIDKLTPRQFVAGLMRGDRATLQQGYTPEAASLVVARNRNLNEHELAILNAYAQGFADGLVESADLTNPAARESEAHIGRSAT